MAEITKQAVIEDQQIKQALKDIDMAAVAWLNTVIKITDESKKMSAALQAANITQLTTDTKAYNEALKTQAQAEQEVVKLDKLKVDLSEKVRKAEVAKTKEAEKATKQSAALASEYAKQSKRLNEMRNEAKDLALKYGENSKQFKIAATEVSKLDNKLKSVDATLGQHNRKVGNYERASKGLTSVMGTLGLAIGGVALAKKAFTETLKSSQAAGDAWAVTLGGMTTATSVFFKMVGTGDFSNFIGRLKDAAKAGREYAAALDDLFEGSLSLELAEVRSRAIVLQEEKIRDDVRKTTDERLAAAKKINDEELRILDIRKIELGKAYNAHAKLIEGTTQLSREELIQFIENYRTQEGLRDKAIAKGQEIDELSKKITSTYVSSTGMVTTVTNERIANQVKLIQETFTAEEKVYYDFYKRYQATADKEVDNVIKSYVAIMSADNDMLEATRRNNKKLATFEKELTTEKEKNIVREQELLTDLIKRKEAELAAILATSAGTETEIINRKFAASAIEEQIKKLKELGDIKQADKLPFTTEQLKKETDSIYDYLTKADEDYINEQIANWEKERDALREHEQQKADIRAEYADIATNGIMEIEDSLFANRADAREAETQKEIEFLQKRLENEKLDEEQRAEVQKEIDKKERAMKRRNAKAEKDDALLKLGIDTALTISKLKTQAAIYAFTNPVFAAGALAQIPFVLVSAGLTATAIAARKIPEYAKGTSNHKGGAAWLGDGGKVELVTEPTGKRYLTPDTPTLMDLPAGTKVTPGDKVAHELQMLTRREMVELGNGQPKQRDNQLLTELLIEHRKTRKAIEKQKPHQQQDISEAVRFEIMKLKMKN